VRGSNTLDSYLQLGSYPKGLLSALGQDAAGGSLAAARSVLTQLLKLLAQLHAAKLVHRDIKPSNILVLEGKKQDALRLIDLGACADLKDGFNFTVGACPRCVALAAPAPSPCRVAINLSARKVSTMRAQSSPTPPNTLTSEAARRGGRMGAPYQVVGCFFSSVDTTVDSRRVHGKWAGHRATSWFTYWGANAMAVEIRGTVRPTATLARPRQRARARRWRWRSWASSGRSTSRRASTCTRRASCSCRSDVQAIVTLCLTAGRCAYTPMSESCVKHGSCWTYSKSYCRLKPALSNTTLSGTAGAPHTLRRAANVG
jgi:serine/threonine protein kinase